MQKKNRSFFSGFLHASDGVIEAWKSERSFRVHIVMATLVTILGFLLRISAWEWIICVILFSLVISSELLNTALETTIDICSPHLDPLAKRVKDVAAASVLIVAFGSAIVGMIIFAAQVVGSLFWISFGGNHA